MSPMNESGRKPLSDVQRQRIGERIEQGERHLVRNFGSGGGFAISASPDRLAVFPEIPNDSMDDDVTLMTARAMEAAVDYATYGPGYWQISSSECIWVSLTDENGEGITPPSAIALPDSYWCWDQEAGESVEVCRSLILLVSSDGTSLSILHADNGEELLEVAIRDIHELLNSMVRGHTAPVSAIEQDHAREGSGSDEIEFGRGRQDHPGHLQVIVSLHHLAAALSGWVMMHTE